MMLKITDNGIDYEMPEKIVIYDSDDDTWRFVYGQVLELYVAQKGRAQDIAFAFKWDDVATDGQVFHEECWIYTHEIKNIKFMLPEQWEKLKAFA